MASKRRLHHWLTMLRHVKTWQLVLIALILTAASIILLRENSMQAVRLFEAVKQADREGKDTTGPLKRLQRYVSTHMNTQLERVSLEKTYARDYQKALKKLTSSGSVNEVNYNAAQAACQPELARTGSFPAYAQCVSDRVGQVAPGENPLLRANLPKPERYQFAFVSPAWSADAAGITLLITGVAWLLIAGKLIARAVLALLIRVPA